MKYELRTFNRDVSNEDLLQDLAAVHAKVHALGKRLTFRSYNEFGKYSASTIGQRFGSWNDGLRTAGIVPSEEKNVSIEALFDNLKLVWIARGRQPVFRDMRVAPSQYTASIYGDRFGGWRKALHAFVASVENEEGELLPSENASKFDRKDRKATPRDPSLALRFFVLKRDRFCCISCGRSPATVAGLVLEVDHVIPWVRGGLTIAENLQTLCFDCNRGKAAT